MEDVLLSCYNCGNTSMNETIYKVSSEHYLCYSCYAEERFNVKTYKLIAPKGANENKFYYGFEIEFELLNMPYGRHINDFLLENFDDTDLIYKIAKDGSLDRLHGVEIATQPLSEDRLKDIRYIYNFINEYGFIKGTRAGLHVNIDKRCISKLTILKMYYFLSNKIDFTNIYSQRNGNYYYCNMHNKREVIYKILNKIDEMTKYTAINLNYDNRYEFRLFNATTNYKNAIYKAKFLKRLANFLKTKSIKEILQPEDDLYIEFIKNETEELRKEMLYV